MYFPAAHWVVAFECAAAEKGGWIANTVKALDFAGGTAIHINAGAAALALAAAFGCRVDDLFRLESSKPHDAEWAWRPVREPCRYWLATVAGRRLRYPVEPSPLGAVEHDGVFRDGQCFATAEVDPERTIILACCDPAVGLLAPLLHKSAAGS